MSRAAIFTAVRDARGKGFTPDEVPILDVVLDRLGVPKDDRPCGLKNEAAFFENLRKSGLFVGGIDQSQVDGIKAKVDAFTAAGWSLSFAAYAMATSYWETAHKMQPVREAYWLNEGWRQKNLRYYPHYGRGDVQLTWPKNYARADDELGLAGKLIADPDLALDPAISARIMVKGMEEGWFTGKKLADTLPTSRPANFEEFRVSRPIINGTDKAHEIANVALRFQAALQAGGWA